MSKTITLLQRRFDAACRCLDAFRVMYPRMLQDEISEEFDIECKKHDLGAHTTIAQWDEKTKEFQ